MIRFVLPRPTPKPAPRPITAPRRGLRAARQLALAHAAERWVEDGVFRDHAQVAAALGITPARMSQIASLRRLAPTIQARVLAGENIHERSLRAATRFVDWSDQVAALKDKVK